MSTQTNTHAHADHQHVHVVSLAALFGTFFALLVLTALTFFATEIDLGRFGNLVVALVIALLKAALVALFFMHLWWDKPFNALILIFSLAFVVLFIGATIHDSLEYQPNLTPPSTVAPRQ